MTKKSQINHNEENLTHRSNNGAEVRINSRANSKSPSWKSTPVIGGGVKEEEEGIEVDIMNETLNKEQTMTEHTNKIS